MENTEKYIRCKRCNRPLKTLEAQERGYGAFCYKQHLKENGKHQPNLFEDSRGKLGGSH